MFITHNYVTLNPCYNNLINASNPKTQIWKWFISFHKIHGIISLTMKWIVQWKGAYKIN